VRVDSRPSAGRPGSGTAEADVRVAAGSLRAEARMKGSLPVREKKSVRVRSTSDKSVPHGTVRVKELGTGLYV
jgi:hypothetical protein